MNQVYFMNQPRSQPGYQIAGALAYANVLALGDPWLLGAVPYLLYGSHDGTKLLSVPIIPPHRPDLVLSPMKRSATRLKEATAAGDVRQITSSTGPDHVRPEQAAAY